MCESKGTTLRGEKGVSRCRCNPTGLGCAESSTPGVHTSDPPTRVIRSKSAEAVENGRDDLQRRAKERERMVGEGHPSPIFFASVRKPLKREGLEENLRVRFAQSVRKALKTSEMQNECLCLPAAGRKRGRNVVRSELATVAGRRIGTRVLLAEERVCRNAKFMKKARSNFDSKQLSGGTDLVQVDDAAVVCRAYGARVFLFLVPSPDGLG